MCTPINGWLHGQCQDVSCLRTAQLPYDPKQSRVIGRPALTSAHTSRQWNNNITAAEPVRLVICVTHRVSMPLLPSVQQQRCSYVSVQYEVLHTC